MTEENKYITQIKKALKPSGKPLQDSFFNQLNQQIPTTQISDDDLTRLSLTLITYLNSLNQRSQYEKRQYIIDVLGKIGRRVQNNKTLQKILSILNQKIAHPNLRQNILQAFELLSLNPVLIKDETLSRLLLLFLLHILDYYDDENPVEVQLKEKAAAILQNINPIIIDKNKLQTLFTILSTTSSDSIKTSVRKVIKNALTFRGGALDNDDKLYFRKVLRALGDSPSSSFSRTARRMIDTATAHLPSLPKFHKGDDLGEERGNQPQGILITLFFLLLL